MGAKEMTFEGTIVRGLGEGTYFMSMQHYRKEVRKKLGFEAYPGTLNLKVDRKKIDSLKNFNQIKISGFKKMNKTLGGAGCYRAKIKNINGAIIVPDFTRHKENIIEIIAPVHLKSELRLREGDKLKVELQ